MLYTPAEAAKLLKQLQEEEKMLLQMERESATFTAAHVENPESLRPAYSLPETEHRLNEIRTRILKVKHAINRFNLTHEVKEGVTVDMVLVLLPKLTERVGTLRMFASMSEKPRRRSSTGNFIEYLYTNFDQEDAQAAYQSASRMLDDYRLSLDNLNLTCREVVVPD